MPSSPVHSNSIMALRAREMATRVHPYRSRGCKLRRCPHCLLHASNCLCSSRPLPLSNSAFCFIMYNGEAFKPSNTGRLLADLTRENHAFVHDRTQPDQALLALLADPGYSPIVVFPHQYATDQRCIHSPIEAPGVNDGRRPLFIMLDGTWREAKKIFRCSWLNSFPVLGIEPLQSSDYGLREAAHLHQLCTAEVGIAILRLNNEEAAAEAMQDYFTAFRRLYMAGKQGSQQHQPAVQS